MSATPMCVGLLGAECTGKTTLAQALAAHLRGRGEPAFVVPEALRLFCERAGRTPRPQEQRAILDEQNRRIAAASASGAHVFADTTALMTAAYSECLFGDASLTADAWAAQRTCTHTLLLSPDLPWQADGIFRDGPAARMRVDAWLRQALATGGVPWQAVEGSGPERLRAALAALGY